MCIRSFYSQYNEFIEIKDKKLKYKIKFFQMTKHLKDIFAIPEGTSALKVLIEYFQKDYMDRFKGKGKEYPVIMLLDTDNGVKEIKKHLKHKDFKEPFYKVCHNLYVVYISDKKGIEIEMLFDKEVLETKIDGKSFNIKKKHGSETEYGKHIFAEKGIKKNKFSINFENFKPILEKFKKVVLDNAAIIK